MKNLIALFLLLILISSNQLFGQENKVFHFGLSAIPQINISKFEKPDIGIGKNTFSIKGQFDLYYDVNSRLQINSGLNLKSLQISSIDYSPTFGCDSVSYTHLTLPTTPYV